MVKYYFLKSYFYSYNHYAKVLIPIEKSFF